MVGSIAPAVSGSGQKIWKAVAILVLHLAGGALSGAFVGLAIGAFGGVVRAAGVGEAQLWPALGAIGGLLVLREFGVLSFRLPSTDRQVDASWRHRFPQLLWSFGYGFELGTGFRTRITFGSYYVAVLIVFGTMNPVVGMELMGLYGFARGIPVVVTSALKMFGPDPGVDAIWALGKRTPIIQALNATTLLAVVGTAIFRIV